MFYFNVFFDKASNDMTIIKLQKGNKVFSRSTFYDVMLTEIKFKTRFVNGNVSDKSVLQ